MFQQFGGDSLVQGIFKQLVELELKVAVRVVSQQFFREDVNDRLEVKLSREAELDVLGVAEYEPAISYMLFEGVVEDRTELSDRQVPRDKSASSDVVDISGQQFLPCAGELYDLYEDFGDIVGCQ